MHNKLEIIKENVNYNKTYANVENGLVGNIMMRNVQEIIQGLSLRNDG